MKKFLTVFFPTEPVHLYKDVGMIPYSLARYCGWESSLAYLNTKGEIADNNYEKHVKLIPIKNSKNKFVKLFTIFKFIRLNAKKYNIVNFYHGSKDVLLMALLFKFFNSDIKVYVKLDLNRQGFENFINPPSLDKKIKKVMKNFISVWFVDLYSVETKAFFQTLSAMSVFKNKLIYIPNGMLMDDEKSSTLNENKENIILTVGRIGAYEKNHELLVDAITHICPEKICNWKIYFIGPIVETKFLDYIDAVCNKKPYLRDVFVFTGNITDKKELYKIYARAKVFCLTSRWEGFPLVVPEAMFFGDYIIVTDYPAAYDLTADSTLGDIIPNNDVQSLTKCIEKIIDNKINMDEYRFKTENYVKGNFNWEKIAEKLERYLV